MTCFFAVHAGASLEPAKRGSRGAGFSTESGVRSRVKVEGAAHRATAGPELPFELVVRDHGVTVTDPVTTRGALRELVRRASAGAHYRQRVVIDNDYSLPLGAGFGMSGACALSAVLAANKALALGLSFDDCVASAHVGEVEARSGLGDVVAQAAGGFEARVREGAPPHGALRKWEVGEVPVVLVSFGPIHTGEFLAREDRLAELNAVGEDCLQRLLEGPSLPAAVRLGREFASRLGLISERAQALLAAHANEAEGTVAMLGDSLVFLDPPAGLAEAAKREGAPFAEKTRLTHQGARLLGTRVA